MKTASIIIIGNEILSGRTKDTNSNYLAKILVKKALHYGKLEFFQIITIL